MKGFIRILFKELQLEEARIIDSCKPAQPNNLGALTAFR